MPPRRAWGGVDDAGAAPAVTVGVDAAAAAGLGGSSVMRTKLVMALPPHVVVPGLRGLGGVSCGGRHAGAAGSATGRTCETDRARTRQVPQAGNHHDPRAQVVTTRQQAG